ncbi:MAG: DUF4070 domain-containing protein [Parcubacteria group bacterium]|nr:MAG: DUF4070 domain-containing protein [Parcubacteria group bacterium]
MKILLLYPQYPTTFWSFTYALPFVGKKAAFPPLGLLTVASMLPSVWEKKVVDLNVSKLKEEDIKWADFVFISAMIIQKESVEEIIKKCQKLKVKTVAGGPLFTTGYEEFKGRIDHFILNEAEGTLPLFLADLEKGQLKEVYTSSLFPDISKTPAPLWSLIDFKPYSSMNIQFSRRCPFNCEFCDIVIMNGRVPRIKSKEQVIKELDILYSRGWRGNVFFVDDNFIGNKAALKKEILPALISWMEERDYPFHFNTEASINLADDEELLRLMAEAGFNTVFIGIETPDEFSLKECGKVHNTNRSLLDSIRKIQNYGLQVQAGFIVGFDNDTPSIFERQINFIQRSGIVTAMVGLLGALPKTRLYERLKKEGRLLNNPTGDNTDHSLNFMPKMGENPLMDGYKRILTTIYSPKNYYARIETFLKNYKPLNKKKWSFRMSDLSAFIKSIWLLGVIGEERFFYWKILFKSLFTRPRLFPLTITLSIYGFHFRKVAESYT